MFLSSSPLTGGYPAHGPWGTAGVGLTVGCVNVFSVDCLTDGFFFFLPEAFTLITLEWVKFC